MGAGNDVFVFVDPNLGSGGGTGTPVDPVDTVAAAHPLAVANNRRAVFLVRDGLQTLTALGWEHFNFNGPEANGAANAAAIALNAQPLGGSVFRGLAISGDAGGAAFAALDCDLSLLTNALGRFKRCTIAGTLALVGAARLEDCQAFEPVGLNTFVLDLSGVTGAQTVSLSGFKGFVRVTGLADAAVRLEISGPEIEVELAASVTDGTVVLRGAGKLTNSSTPNVLTVDRTAFVERDNGEVQINGRYVDGTDSLVLNAWLERNGAALAGAVNGQVEIFDENGVSVIASAVVPASDAQGVFRFSEIVPAGAGTDTMVYAKVTLEDALGQSLSGITGITIRPES